MGIRWLEKEVDEKCLSTKKNFSQAKCTGSVVIRMRKKIGKFLVQLIPQIFRTGFKIIGCLKLTDRTLGSVIFADMAIASFNFAIRFLVK